MKYTKFMIFVPTNLGELILLNKNKKNWESHTTINFFFNAHFILRKNILIFQNLSSSDTKKSYTYRRKTFFFINWYNNILDEQFNKIKNNKTFYKPFV